VACTDITGEHDHHCWSSSNLSVFFSPLHSVHRIVLVRLSFEVTNNHRLLAGPPSACRSLASITILRLPRNLISQPRAANTTTTRLCLSQVTRVTAIDILVRRLTPRVLPTLILLQFFSKLLERPVLTVDFAGLFGERGQVPSVAPTTLTSFDRDHVECKI
jgi:hypothetical protein